MAKPRVPKQESAAPQDNEVLGGRRGILEEVDNESENDANQENDQAGFESEENADLNEEPGTGEYEESNTGTPEETQDNDREVNHQSELELLKSQNTELMKRLQALEGKPQTQQAPQPQEFTEEQWNDIYDRSGFTDKKQVKFISDLITRGMTTVFADLNNKIAGINAESALDKWGKSNPDFADYGEYKGDINKYLNQFDVTERNNPELFQQAYYFAVGKASKRGSIEDREADANRVPPRQQRRVVVPSRPRSQSNNKAPKSFSPYQIRAMKQSNMSPDEYERYNSLTIDEMLRG